MERLNYHHLYYFWVVTAEGGINRAAAKLRLSPSALSSQIKSLEDFFKQPLFERKAQRLHLSESGRVALEYAKSIFSTGDELLEVMRNPTALESRRMIRVGALAGLSKNLQFLFASPCLKKSGVSIVATQGSLSLLLRQLENHLLDVVISNMSVRTDQQRHLFNHTMAEVPSVIVGTRKWLETRKGFPKSLETCPLFVPTHESKLRADFDLYLQEQGIRPIIKAEIEDIALLRYFALSGDGVALLPEIAVERDIKEKRLWVIRSVPELRETFFAITAERKFANPLVREMVTRFKDRYLKSEG